MSPAEKQVLIEVFGWVGCIAAWLLFLSPIPTLRTICRRGYIGDFSCLPYLITTLNCGLWAVYALPWVTPHKEQPLVTNVVGFVLEMICAHALLAHKCANYSAAARSS